MENSITLAPMKTINLGRFIADKGLDKKDVAELLFPGNKHAGLSLNRIIKGEGYINTEQASRLAMYAGTDISELFGNGGWSAKSMNGIHIFTYGGYKAELDTKTWTTKIFHKGNLFHETVLHDSAIPLNEYLEKLNEIINNN